MKIDNIEKFAQLANLTVEEVISFVEQSRFTTRRWSETDIKKLEELIDNGVSVAQISSELGRSTGAIYARIKRLETPDIEWTKAQIMDFDYEVTERGMSLSNWASKHKVSLRAVQDLQKARHIEYEKTSDNWPE